MVNDEQRIFLKPRLVSIADPDRESVMKDTWERRIERAERLAVEYKGTGMIASDKFEPAGCRWLVSYTIGFGGSQQGIERSRLGWDCSNRISASRAGKA